MLEGLVILVGAVGTLMYFQFGANTRPDRPPRRAPVVEGLALIGQVFIGITLGALFAGVYAAAITALVERWLEIITTIANSSEGAPQMTSLVDAESVLTIDIGSVNTRALLFDVVDGQYHFLAGAVAPFTGGAPFFDISEGVAYRPDTPAGSHRPAAPR